MESDLQATALRSQPGDFDKLNQRENRVSHRGVELPN